MKKQRYLWVLLPTVSLIAIASIGWAAWSVPVTAPSQTINERAYSITFIDGDWSNTIAKLEADSAFGFPEIEQEGKTLDGWRLSNGTSASLYKTTSSIDALISDAGDPANHSFTFSAEWSMLHCTVTYSLEGGSGAISPETVDYGQTFHQPTNPTRTGYTFLGWSTKRAGEELYDFSALACSDLLLYAQWAAKTLTVTWRNHDGTTLATTSVPYGKTPSYGGLTPTREKTAQYSYAFEGWSPALSPITINTTYVATYSSSVNQYSVTWQNWNGDFIKTETVPYGTTPSYVGVNPTRPQDAQYTYEFIGWDPEITPVTGNQTYNAKYAEHIRSYAITFLNYDRSLLQQTTYEYGQTPVYSGSTPTKPSEGEKDFVFTGWSPEIKTVDGEQEYVAQFSEVPKEYTVTFNSHGGTEVASQTVTTGNYATRPEDPTKDGFVFDGWYLGSSFVQLYDFENTPVVTDITLHAK